VDQTITGLLAHMEPGDIIIDGGNEWYENTERRVEETKAKGVLYLGMGVSGGEEGARRGAFAERCRLLRRVGAGLGWVGLRGQARSGSERRAAGFFTPPPSPPPYDNPYAPKNKQARP